VSVMLSAIDTHTHISSSPGSATGMTIPPVKPFVDAFLREPVVDTFLTIVKKQPPTT